MDTGSSGLKITLEQIADLAESTYTLADVRDEISFRYGTIPRAAFRHGVWKAGMVRGCGRTPSGQIALPRSRLRSRETGDTKRGCSDGL